LCAKTAQIRSLEACLGELRSACSLLICFSCLNHIEAEGLARGYAEAEAKKRGCSTAVLYTITFQAPAFYERQGYQVLGHVECQPPGHTRLCMTKKL
jgi:hypothetical protein